MSTSGFRESLSEIAFMLLVALAAIVTAPLEVTSLVFSGIPKGPKVAVVRAATASASFWSPRAWTVSSPRYSCPPIRRTAP